MHIYIYIYVQCWAVAAGLLQGLGAVHVEPLPHHLLAYVYIYV